jgi:hypothetical protein
MTEIPGIVLFKAMCITIRCICLTGYLICWWVVRKSW